MNLQKYRRLTYFLSKASNKKNNVQDYSSELNKACKLIDQLVANSDNKIITIWEVERVCLVYDRDANIHKNSQKLNSRFTGCLAAIKDYQDLTINTAKYVKEFITFQPYDIKSATTFLKETFNALKYLGIEKNASSTIMAGQLFFEKRQDILKQGREVFLQEKQQKFEKILTPQKEIEKDRGLER